jgi:ubiquinone/menaquinone biosynthesis C-methylase UbiE
VRHPDDLLKEVFRVLKPGGYFTGSVSYLEPYHSFSIYNFTPYGLLVSLTDAGFKLKELRPGIDGPTLILRQMLNAPQKLQPLFNKVSLFNFMVNVSGFIFRFSHREKNFLKLQFAGQICFLAEKNSWSLSK